MLDLHLSKGQGLLIETPSGAVEVWALEVQPAAEQATLEIVLPDEWWQESTTTPYRLHDEFTLDVPDGRIRIKLLRFRQGKYGGSGSVSLGIDAPRDWPVSR